MSQNCQEYKLSGEEQSVEILNSGGARKSKLALVGKTALCAYENMNTTWNALQEGKKISGNEKCLGWKSSDFSYSWNTYNELIKRAENFGLGLKKIGLKPGQSTNVGIYAKNSVEWVVAQYGIWSQSGVLVPLYDSIGPETSIFMINQAEIEVTICDNEQKVKYLVDRKRETPSLKHIITMSAASYEFITYAKENGVSLHSFSEVEEMGEKFWRPPSYPKSSDIALICYTSGTTGDPKGVILTHQNVMSSCTALHLMMGDSAPSKEDTVMSYLPMVHLFGQVVQLLLLMVGGSIGFFSGDINQLEDDMRILKPTVFPAVPRMLNKLYEQAQILIQSKSQKYSYVDNSTTENELKSICKPFKDSIGSRIRLILSGGAPIYKKVLEFFTKILGCKVTEFYGQTEGGVCTVALIDSDYTGDVGTPVPSCIVKLVDVPEMGYYSKNSTGEICIKGSGVFKGYLKDPKKSAEALHMDGWLLTGDIGMWLPNGTMKIIDRKKSILKLAQGLYVAPEKIENIYVSSPFVSQIFVDGDSLKSVVFAIVIPEKKTLLPWCEQNLKTCDSWIDICKNPSVKQFIIEDMLKIGKEAELLSFEQVKDIHLHPEMLTYEGGFLTSSLKLKREVWKTHFTLEIEALKN